MLNFVTRLNTLAPEFLHLLNLASGTAPQDSSVNARHGTVVNSGGITYGSSGTPVAGLSDNAMLHGSTAFTTIPMASDFFARAVAAGGLTVSFWFKHNAGNGPSLGFDGGATMPSLYIQCTTATNLQTSLYNPNYATYAQDNAVVANAIDGAWHYYTATLNLAGKGWVVTVDGVVKGRTGAQTTTLITGTLPETTRPFGVGGIATAAATATAVQNGAYYGVQLYARPLTFSEIQYSYFSGYYLFRPDIECPLTYAQNTADWFAIGKRARTGRVECHLIGESTQAVGGNGYNTFQLFDRLHSALTGTNSPGAGWHMSTGWDGPGAKSWPYSSTDVTATVVATNLPPAILAYDTINTGTAIQELFDRTGWTDRSLTGVAVGNGQRSDPASLVVEVVAKRKSGSGAITLAVQGIVSCSTAAAAVSPIYPATQLFSAVELDNADGAYIKKTSSTINLGGNPNAYYTLGYSSAGARIVGMRCYDPTKSGFIFSHFAVGGYKYDTAVSNHTGCGPVLQAYGVPDFVLVDLGINDNSGGGGNSASTVKTNILAFIAAYRTYYGSPTLKFVFTTHTYFTTSVDASKIYQGDQYAGAIMDICEADPLVAMINVRRFLRQAGWSDVNSGSATNWLSDGTHYTALGGAMKASAMATLLSRLLSDSASFGTSIGITL